MPEVRRTGKPVLHYALDDHTDPWRDAPHLILQHGYGRSGRFWYSWVPYLSRFYKVVRPDLRGLGQSEVPADLDHDVNVEAYHEDLLAIIAALGGPVHYCGESLGGILGMVLAAEHPDRLRTLSLVAAPLLINKDTQRTFAFDHPTWQDALRSMGSAKWAEAANSATRFPDGTDPGLLAWYARIFPLKAQDRAIRAEESLRYYILTGKRLDPRLTMSQIVGLRFASDAEFPDLARKAADESGLEAETGK